MEYTLMYCEINLISLMILAIIVFMEEKDQKERAEQHAFERVVLAVFIVLVFDILWVLIQNYSKSIMLNWIVNMLYMIATGFVSILWVQYIYAELGIFTFSRKKKVLLALPLIVLIVLCLLSPATKWIFYIDNYNHYNRGSLNMIQRIICSGYLIYSVILTIIDYRHDNNTVRKAQNKLIVSFIIMPIIGIILQTHLNGLPIIWPMITLSILLICINSQNKQISTDGLTGLNNRRQFDNYLERITFDRHNKTDLYLLLLDIDNFKQINDKYGHQEGDNALIQVAGVLKDVCGSYDAFLARYGGEEFAIIIETNKNKVIDDLKHDIDIRLDKCTADLKLKYKLGLSKGVSLFNEDGKYPVEYLINDADQAMYQDKNMKKRSL